MYSPVGIQQLSNAQIKKLITGGRIRVKAGSALKVNMVREHSKKLASAAKKGSGMMIQLDPYACDLNRDLEGCGVGKKIKAGFKKVGQFVKANKESFRPLATSLKETGRQAIADASMAALDYGIDPALVSAYSQLAQEAIPSGQGFGKKLTKFVRSPAVKTIRKALRPLAQELFEGARDLAFQGLEQGMSQAQSGLDQQGMGIGKQITKFVRGPAAKTVRKAFRPLAQQAFGDAQDLAFQGLEQGMDRVRTGMEQQGMGIGKQITKFVRGPAAKTVRKAFRPLAQQAFNDAQELAYQGLEQGMDRAQSGSGIRQIANARRRMSSSSFPSGGALFPAGGALFPAGYY